MGPRWPADATAAAAQVGLDVEDYVASPHVLAGDADGIATTVLARHADLGVGYFSIPGWSLEDFAAVLERLDPAGNT
jgi:hypothetical protein